MDPGAAIVIVSAAVAATTALALRPRIPGWISIVLVAASSAAVAWGGMLLRPDPAPWQVALAVAAMAVLGPFHVRVVLGPYGPARGG